MMNFAFKNERLCIKNEKLCIKNEELCIKVMSFAAPSSWLGTVSPPATVVSFPDPFSDRLVCSLLSTDLDCSFFVPTGGELKCFRWFFAGCSCSALQVPCC